MRVAETAYVFGAGINRAPGSKDEGRQKPPLVNDFFQLFLNSPVLDQVKHNPKGAQRYQKLLEYIERYWKLTEDDLKASPFDLEECFTLLQLQRTEQPRGSQQYRELLQLESDLTSLMGRYLGKFEEQFLYANALEELGEKIWQEQSSVLTFNYDLILERAIETAAGDTGHRPSKKMLEAHESIPDDLLDKHTWKWARALGYGVQFDEIQLQRLKKRPGLVEGKRFYNHQNNVLHNPPLLKLHGSLNWFEHTSVAATDTSAANPKDGTSVLLEGYPWNLFGLGPPEIDGWLLEPLIIIPVLHKDLSTHLIKETWTQAKNELQQCQRLVIGGYSFPASDFHTRKLLLEAFENHSPQQLIIINPDSSVVSTAKSLCHFDKPVTVCANLQEYLAL